MRRSSTAAARSDASAVRRHRAEHVITYSFLLARRAHLPLPVPHPDRDVVQDRAERDRQPARPRARARRRRRRSTSSSTDQDFLAVGQELGDRHALRHVRPRLLRQPRRLRARAAALPRARRGFATIVAVMAVPGVVLLIPKFLIISQLGIYDTYDGMIIPLLVDAAGVFIMKNFFESIPVERRGVRADRRRRPLPHLLVDRAADGTAGARSRSSSSRSRARGTSSRTSSSPRRARASTR